MAVDNARKFIKDMQENDKMKKSFGILKNEALNILAFAHELGYDFTPDELIEAFTEYFTK